TTGATTLFTDSGSATSDGFLNLSTNGQYLLLAGYRAAIGTANVVSTTSAASPRVIGRITVATGAVDTSTALTDAYSGNNIRSATSDDGTRFWTGGTSSTVGGGALRPFRGTGA